MRLVLLVLAGLLALAAADDKKVVCYFGSWAIYRPGNGKLEIADIDPTLCTHLVYAFVGVSPDGQVNILDRWADLPDGYGKDGFARFNKLRARVPGVKTMIAIGGWTDNADPFSPVMMNPSIRRRFVDNVVAFVKQYGFDGFDLDWEYPNKDNKAPADVENFVSLVKELREKFDSEGLILSAAVGASEKRVKESYNVREIAKHLDFINLMTYDLHGLWDKKTGMNAPLRAGPWESGSEDFRVNVESIVDYWLKQGTPPNKLVLGVPTYGRGFQLSNPSNNAIGAPVTIENENAVGTAAGPYTKTAGTLGYNEICEKMLTEDWTVVYDEDQRVPYAYKGNQWIGYDNERSIKEKAEFAKSKGLGGMMIWSLETDDFKGICGDKYPLLKVINREFRGASIPGSPSKPTASRPAPFKPTVNKPQAPAKPFLPSAPTKPSVPSAPSSGNICNAQGYVRDSKNCNVYYFCQYANGKYNALRLSCPPGLYYSGDVCDYPQNVPGC